MIGFIAPSINVNYWGYIRQKSIFIHFVHKINAHFLFVSFDKMKFIVLLLSWLWTRIRRKILEKKTTKTEEQKADRMSMFIGNLVPHQHNLYAELSKQTSRTTAACAIVTVFEHIVKRMVLSVMMMMVVVLYAFFVHGLACFDVSLAWLLKRRKIFYITFFYVRKTQNLTIQQERIVPFRAFASWTTFAKVVGSVFLLLLFAYFRMFFITFLLC